MPLATLTRLIASRLKPHRTEAIARIRFNALSLLVLVLLTSTVPVLPSLPTAIFVVIANRSWLFPSSNSSSSSRNSNSATRKGSGSKIKGVGGGRPRNTGGGRLTQRWDYTPLDLTPPPPAPTSTLSETAHTYLCLLLTSLLLIFLFNILESLYALKYPRQGKAVMHSSSPNPLGASSPSGAQKKRKVFEGVSIAGGSTTSPQPQRPFTFSSSLSSSTPYPLSPLSTPSRSLHYTPLTPNARSSLASSSSSSASVMYTPSPSSHTALGVSALGSLGPSASYRGRKFGGSVARPLDGSYLGRIVKTEPDSDEEL